MRLQYHSDIGKPCYRCDCTIFTYYVDDCVSLVDAFCHACHAQNTFTTPMYIDSPQLASLAHRNS